MPQCLDDSNEDIKKPNPIYHEYVKMTETFGIEFIDIPLDDYSKVKDEDIIRLNAQDMSWYHASHFPLVSINQIKWNPNQSSYTWIFTGTESGLCRISCCSFFLKPIMKRDIFKSVRKPKAPLKMISSHTLLNPESASQLLFPSSSSSASPIKPTKDETED